MFSETVIKESKRIGGGLLILYAVMLVFFALFGYFDSRAVLGGLLGIAAAFLNFVFLGISIERAVKANPKGAQGAMGGSYILRLLFLAAVIYWAIKAPYFNYIAAVIPLIFPRLIIMFLSFRDSKKGGTKN